MCAILALSAAPCRAGQRGRKWRRAGFLGSVKGDSSSHGKGPATAARQRGKIRTPSKNERMNSKTNAVTFAFRRPRFSLICDLDGELFATESAAALRRLLVRVELLDKEKIRFVDTSGEG